MFTVNFMEICRKFIYETGLHFQDAFIHSQNYANPTSTHNKPTRYFSMKSHPLINALARLGLRQGC